MISHPASPESPPKKQQHQPNRGDTYIPYGLLPWKPTGSCSTQASKHPDGGKESSHHWRICMLERWKCISGSLCLVSSIFAREPARLGKEMHVNLTSLLLPPLLQDAYRSRLCPFWRRATNLRGRRGGGAVFVMGVRESGYENIPSWVEPRFGVSWFGSHTPSSHIL